MRKKYIIYFSIFLILITLLIGKKLNNIKFMVFNPVSSSTAEEIVSSRERVERFEFRTLLCNGVQVPVDYIEKTFYVPLNMENKEWENMEFASGDSQLQLLFWDDFTKYDKQKVIAEGNVIEFLVYNDIEYAPYYIIFTGLPVMDISTEEGIQHAKEIEGHAVFYDTSFPSTGYQYSAYEGHVRGNTSTLYPKKGYKINLKKRAEGGLGENNQLPLFGMRKDDDWILSALYNDDSKLRAKLSIDLWDEIGAKTVVPNSKYNTSMRYIELIVDEAYHGLYGLMEPIDAKQLNLKTEDYLYKREEPMDLEATVFETVTEVTENLSGFELKEGSLDIAAWEPMAQFVAVTSGSDEIYMKQISDVADEDNMMRLWLYLQIVSGCDQNRKNVFYVARKTGDSYEFSFAPWDMDLTWGNISTSEGPWYTKYDQELLYKSFQWSTGERLIGLNVNGAVENMQKLYRNLRQNILSEAKLQKRIMELDHTLRDSGAYERERKRWPEGAYADNCGIVLEYAKQRMNYLDKALFNN